MKRALIFSTAYFPLVGGAEIAVKEITDRLPDWECHLVCAKIRPGLAYREQIGRVLVHRIGIGKPVDKVLLLVFGPLFAFFLGRFDVVWSLMASYGGFASLVYTWFKPTSQFLLTLQEGDPLDHYAKRAGRLAFLHKKIFQRADAVQAISRFLADWAVSMGFRGTLDVVPNGVNLETFTHHAPYDMQQRKDLRKQWEFGDADFLLVTVSRLALKNGVDDLIRSLVFLPAHVKVVIAGEGEDRDKLRVLTEQKELTDRVVFLGGRSHEELPTILRACDCFVRASLSEGLGMAFLEAMAVGLPIIGTPVGGIPDFLTDGETGLFCQPHDPESIAKAVRRLMEDASLREKLIRNGEVIVEERYGWEGIAKEMDGMLKALASSR